jgi:hypothetical protein
MGSRSNYIDRLVDVYISLQGLGPTVTKNESVRLILWWKGQILFYTANWNIVSYADMKPVQLQWKQVNQNKAITVESCAKVKNETW